MRLEGMLVTSPLDVGVVEGDAGLELVNNIGPLEVAVVEEGLMIEVELLGLRTLEPAVEKLELVAAFVTEL